MGGWKPKQVGRKNIFLQASEGKKVMKRVLFYLIQNCAPAVGGSLCSVGWVNLGLGREGKEAGLVCSPAVLGPAAKARRLV